MKKYQKAISQYEKKPLLFTIIKVIDLFSLGGLFSHFRPRDETLENSCFQIFK